MSNSSDTVLFVQGIPIDLDRKGLANLFNRAGPVKNARLIPPKNSSYTSTFGFVEFSSQTTAATALQMFNNYKLGTKYLNVSYAQQKTPQDNALSRNSVCSNGRAVSRMSMSNDLNQSSDSDKLSRKSSIGRGSIIHQNQHQRYQRGNYDLSRPFARKVLARQNLSKKTSSKEAFVDAEQPKAQAKSQAKSVEELTMGELYPVYITHVNTPSNFFVHLITAKEKTANLINNMDNYYRNGLHQENADLDTFCETKPASIRCKLAEIRPPRGNSEWSQKAIDTMDTLYKQEDALFAKILSIDEFEPCSGRFETIYGIDLIYGGEESIISYFIQNALAIKENDFTPIRTNNFVKLNAGQTYKVNIQYFDESYESPYFFVCLCKNFAKLEELDGELQKISSDKTQFRYVEDMSELKVNDTLEALFEVDSKWYRVEVRGLKPLDIYFLDFGNSQTITQLVPKTLRYRLKFEADSQIDLFNLDYQAIRCRYESNTENKVSQFLEQISQIEDFEAGFELTVLESDPDGQQQQQQQDSYLVTLDQDHKQHHKHEPKIEEQIEEQIEEKQEEGKASIQLETGSVIDEVSFVHIESVSEFYVQTQDTLRLFIDFQAKIQRLLELMLSNKSSQENRQELFKKGDFVFGKFLSDMNWYRAVIINIEEKSSEKSEFSDLANDGRLYDVYFLDYGNKQENLPSCLLYSFDSVKQLNKHLNLMPVSELNSIIEMPFQAICCQLVEKKNNTRNNEVLKSLLLECLNFSIKIGHTSKQKILHNLEIDKYLVYLSTDGKCLQDQFEDELKVEKSLIKPNGVYECKLSNLDKDIYVNLIDQVDDFLKLETLLTSDEKIGSKWRTDATPNLTDLVLAKYVLDEQTSAWCRARITNKINNVFDVFFIDYGNESLHLALQDLAPLGPLYSLSKYPPFAHKIQLHKIQIDLDKHGQYLGEFLSENFKIKVLSVEQEELCCCLVVELWDTSMSKCLNAIIGDETFSDKIEQTHVQHLYLANKATELKVNVNYAFMDDLLKPFYFCLSDDLVLRSQLDTQLNQFYSTNDVDAPDFTLNAYIAVHSDNSWYRAQIKQMLDTNSIFVFYIDYGFHELIELTEQIKKQKLRKLHAKFYQYPRFVFGAALLNPMAAKADSYELINFESNDNQTLRQTLEDYFTASNSEQFDLVILCKLSSTCLSQNFVPNEDYYGIEMYNADAMSLNEMIVASKQKKPTKPASIRLTMEHIAKQKPLSDQYCVFARAPDHFYVYNEERVLQVQVKTQETCANILQQLQQYEESQEEEKIQVDDLVYAKYDDDETWYRCRVTNYDRESGKFELFYLDFGNIEIVSGSDVLTGWSEHHLQPFVSYEPQAYKCRLYGLANKEYSLEEKNKFKQFTSDKVFDVSFIKVNADGVNEVGLQIGDKSETNVHMFCIGQGIAGFDSFDTILKSKRTSEENKFYINLLSGF